MSNVISFVALCLLIVLPSRTATVTSSSSPSVALCYAYDVPIAQLQQFDWAVVDPDSNFNPKNVSNGQNTTWLAYLSVGEVTSVRSYYNDIPRSWIIGDNTVWASKIINQTADGWSDFFVDVIAAPQWDRGFKGFFMDTLDSYRLVVKTDTQIQEQENGLANVLLALKARFPNAKVIFNRGFEIMPNAHQAASMVAFESLYSGWNQANKEYVSVNQNDRDWLLARSIEIQNNYGLPILSIDYCPNSTCSQNTAKLITQQNIIPYVTDPLLQTVGIGPPKT